MILPCARIKNQDIDEVYNGECCSGYEDAAGITEEG